MSTTTKAIILVIICTVFTSSAQVLFKFGSDSFSFNPILLIQNYLVIIGFFCYAFGALLLILALKEGDLSTIFPFFATSYIWVAVLGFVIFGELLTSIKILGVLFVVFGVSCIGIGGKNA